MKTRPLARQDAPELALVNQIKKKDYDLKIQITVCMCVFWESGGGGGGGGVGGGVEGGRHGTGNNFG